MSEYTNVTVVREANVYFNGGVTSRTIIFGDGSKKTLGVMLPGEYTFTTGVPETMEILSGELDLKVPEGWKRYRSGDSFDLPAETAFTVRSLTLVDYCCSFLG